MLRHRLQLFLAAAAVAMLTACGTFQKPQTAEDNLRYAQATLTGIYRTIGDNVIAGTMTPTEQRSALSRVRPAYDALNEADRILRMGRGNAPEFADKISLARSVLQEVRAILVKRYPSAPIPDPVTGAPVPAS